jgi:purine catabolism regulator
MTTLAGQRGADDVNRRTHDVFLKIVLEGGGLAAIATELTGAIQNSVLITDPGGGVLAGQQNEGDLAEPGLPTSVHLTADGAKVLIGGEELPCTLVPVSAGARLHGHVLALGLSAPSVDDLSAIESASTAAALVLARQAEVVEQEQKYQSSFMYQLLRGNITEATDVVRRSEVFGWGLDRRVIALVVRRDDPLDVGADEELPPVPLVVRSMVLTRDPKATVVRLNDEIVVVTEAFPWENGVANALRYARSLQKVATQGYRASVSVGMSRPVTHVLDVPRAYDQAVTAFRVGRRLHGRGAATHFSELGIDRVLSLVEDREELNSFAQEVLGYVAGDEERAADLRRTLEVLLETNVNVAEAARRLHYHYNTLRFRIEKLERIVGPFRDDARVRLNVHVALLIRRMINPPTQAD